MAAAGGRYGGVGVLRAASDDACPGALRPHHAADGELVRLRVPGGALATATLRDLASAASDLADGRIGLTSRGNLQLRGIRAPDLPVLVERIRAAGLLPATEHERVRNIIASPLSGRSPGSRDDIDPLVHDLDAALCARPALTQLPGRFLFAVDDGSQDACAQAADVLVLALGAGRYAVRPAAVAAGVSVGVADVVAAALAVAECFLKERTQQSECPAPPDGGAGAGLAEGGKSVRSGAAWRIAELDGAGAVVIRRLLAAGWPAEAGVDTAPGRAGTGPPEPGLIEQTDGRFAVCASTPLGLLDADQAQALAAAADLSEAPGALRVTPWRRVVLRDLELPAALAARELLAAVGLVVEPGNAWSRVTACAGRPGCAKSLTDVHADARAFAARADAAGPAVHWAGCERGCGTPTGSGVVRLLATADGYHVDAARLSHLSRLSRLSRRDLAAAGIETSPETSPETSTETSTEARS